MKAFEPFNPRFEACGFHPEEIVARRRDLTDGQKWLYDRLVRWARMSDGERPNERSGEVWRSHENIGRELGKSAKQIGRDLTRLEAVGLLGHRIRDGRKSNTYFFLFHADFQCIAVDSPIEWKRASTQTQDGDVLEGTSASTQTDRAVCGRSDLNGHRRPFISNLNGHPRPSNQKVFNQQSHPPGYSLRFEQGATSRTGPGVSALSECKIQAKAGDGSRAFSMGGWESPEDFEAWWIQLLRKHPNKNHNRPARTLAIELIRDGVLTRAEFENGYSTLAALNAVRWMEQNGRFAPNLYQLLDDRLWIHAQSPAELKPVGVSNASHENAEDYLRRYGIQ